MINKSSHILLLLIGIGFCSNIQIPNSRITLSNISEEELDFGFATSDFSFISPFIINVNNENDWDLYIQSKDLTLISINSQIPIQKIQWKKSTDPQTAYRPLSFEKTWVASNQNNNGSIELDFRILLNWMIPPGEYSVPVDVIIEDKPGISRKRRLIKAKPIK